MEAPKSAEEKHCKRNQVIKRPNHAIDRPKRYPHIGSSRARQEGCKGVQCVFSPSIECRVPDRQIDRLSGSEEVGGRDMQRWHLTKAVDRQLIEVKQTNEHTLRELCTAFRWGGAKSGESLVESCKCNNKKKQAQLDRQTVVKRIARCPYNWTRSLNTEMTLASIKRQMSNFAFCFSS